MQTRPEEIWKANRRWFLVFIFVLPLFAGFAALVPLKNDTPPEPEVEVRAADMPYRPEKAAFSIRFKGIKNPYRLMSLFVMPEEIVELESDFSDGTRSVHIEAKAGEIVERNADAWKWKAPAKPGIYPIRITDLQANETMTLHAFVLVPFDHSGEYLNGYRIGRYEKKPYKNNPIYNRPAGFVEVTPLKMNVPVSPHFTLGQFVAKQKSGFPKYLILREQLLLKLEMILQEVNEMGIQAHTLHVMSGYRTPYYNKLIGNQTTYSRHLYGGAADIFIDTNEDEYMDDLNGDGKATVADAHVLAEIVASNIDVASYRPFIGGLGVYAPAPHRGPFIHVDVRGEPERW